MSTVDPSFGDSEVRPGGSPKRDDLPVFVTFKTGAELLVQRGLVDSITPDGLRYIARTAEKWPFGDSPTQIPYFMMGNARTMETGQFLAFFEGQPTHGGRGPNRAPGASRPT